MTVRKVVRRTITTTFAVLDGAIARVARLLGRGGRICTRPRRLVRRLEGAVHHARCRYVLTNPEVKASSNYRSTMCWVLNKRPDVSSGGSPCKSLTLDDRHGIAERCRKMSLPDVIFGGCRLEPFILDNRRAAAADHFKELLKPDVVIDPHLS